MKCSYCKKAAELVTGKEIYPSRLDLHDTKYWRCRPCQAYVGTHKNSKAHAPLGRMANGELRKAKQEVHRYFDPLWKQGNMSRGDAYAWLAKQLDIRRRECHIGHFDLDRCKQVVDILTDPFPGAF